MAIIDTENGPAPCPDAVAVIGGGRWARVLVDVLSAVVPAAVTISVHSRRNAAAMAAWVDARGLGGRVLLSPEWPRTPLAVPGAIIVANAAQDHEEAVEFALSSGIPVIVEKPIAPTAAAAQRLVELARARNSRFAAAHVFLFARYLDNFAKRVADAGPVESLHIEWADLHEEVRYGERKRYDPSLPVIADLMPHVVAIVDAVARRLPDSCRNLIVECGGALVQAELRLGDVPCNVLMERNGKARRRLVRAVAGGETLQLDFSAEPGTITDGSNSAIGDRHWESGKRPVACMLTAFLAWAAGGERDARLDVAPGLRACQLSDQAQEMSRARR